MLPVADGLEGIQRGGVPRDQGVKEMPQGGQEPVTGATLLEALVRVRRAAALTAPPRPLGSLPSESVPAARRASRLRSRRWGQRSRGGGEADHSSFTGCGRPAWTVHTPAISDSQHGQLAAPLDGLGLRVDTRLTCPPVTVRPSRGRTVGRHPPRNDQTTLRRCRR